MKLFRERKRTARDLAEAAQSGVKARDPQEELRRLLPPVGLALAIAATVLGGIQGWYAYSAESALASAESVTQNARRQLGGLVAEQQESLKRAVNHPEIRAFFGSAEGTDPTRALTGLREGLPDLIDARFVGADVLAAIGEDMASFGYANAEMLLGAARTGEPAPLQVHGAEGRREVVLVTPVHGTDGVMGFVLAKLPYAPLAQVFADVDRDGLVLSLVQGDGRSQGVVLEGGVLRGGMNQSAAIAGSMLRVAYAEPERFYLVGPSSFMGNLLLAALSLLAALGIVLGRLRPDLLHRLTKRGETTSTVEPTVVEQLRGAGAPPAAKSAETAKTPEAPAVAPTPAASSEAAPAPVARKLPGVAVDRSIFRAYDIRGVVGKALTVETARLIGHAVGSEVRQRQLKEVVVGRDGRLSGPELSDALITGLRASGCDVIDIGMVPTPVLYFATHELNTGSGVMVTGSHNPPDYNGFKIVIGGETLSDDAIQALYARIAEGRLSEGKGGLTSMDVIEAYIERISGDIQLETPLKVVIDCGNGVPGAVGPRLFEAIGCEVVPLYCEVDGNFPNHHPDPSEPHNLRDLIMSVKQLKADIGLAFDGDGDRLGVVTPTGKIIYPDRLLMLFAQDVLARNPGASIIFDVKCTGHLAPIILGHGGSPIMWKTGHSLIKRKMKETGSELAGEMSGHFFFKERWYGFDDGLYAGCRLLEILAASGVGVDDIFDELPQGVSTPELKVHMAEGEHYRYIEKFKAASKFEGARLTTIDGVRADWPDGWGLVRCSNTTPCLVLRFDADNEQALYRIQTLFREQMLAIDTRLALPF